MSARETILNRLRAVAAPDIHPPDVTTRRDVVPHKDVDLLACFVAEAQKLTASVHVAASEADAFEALKHSLGGTQQIICWDAAYIPLTDFGAWLQQAGIERRPADDGRVKVSITGADAAIAATGSLVVMSAPGKPRSASLTTDRHIAIIRESQLVYNLEDWFRAQKHDLEAFRRTANIAIISGASRTADIAMELVLGAHGPAELHIIVLRD
ncbi:MAG: lactate utilization protein C [Anaerolineales bacterium]